MAEFTINIDTKFIKWYSGNNILFQHNGCIYTIFATYTLGLEADGAQASDYYILEDYDEVSHQPQTLYFDNFEFTHGSTFYIEYEETRVRGGDDFEIEVTGLEAGDPIPDFKVKFNGHWQANYGEIKFTVQIKDHLNQLGPVELVKMNSDLLVCE